MLEQTICLLTQQKPVLKKIGQLASNLKAKFPTSRIGISSIVTREDCDLTDKN